MPKTFLSPSPQTSAVQLRRDGLAALKTIASLRHVSPSEALNDALIDMAYLITEQQSGGKIAILESSGEFSIIDGIGLEETEG